MQALSLSLLRQARRNCHLTLCNVANIIGVTESTMWKYENGKLPLTSDRLFQLINLYHCSITDVIVRAEK